MSVCRNVKHVDTVVEHYHESCPLCVTYVQLGAFHTTKAENTRLRSMLKHINTPHTYRTYGYLPASCPDCLEIEKEFL